MCMPISVCVYVQICMLFILVIYIHVIGKEFYIQLRESMRCKVAEAG